MANLNIVATTVPSGTCFTTVQALLNIIQKYTYALFPDTYALINYGSSTPPVDQQDRPWVKLNADGSLDDLYVYFDGAWRKNEKFTKGDVIGFTGDVGDITTPWTACVSGMGTVNGVVVPDLTDKFLVGAYDTYSVGDTGGSDEVTLEDQHIPNHEHIVPILGPTADLPFTYGNTTAPLTARVVEPATSSNNQYYLSSSVGGDVAHENRPPYYALGWKIYTGYS